MPRFSIRQLMIAIAITALLTSDPRIAVVLLFLAGSVATLLKCHRRRWAAPYFVTLACVDPPFTWLVMMDYPWNNYRWTWIRLWPILSGLPVAFFLHQSERAGLFVAGILAVCSVVLLTLMGSKGHKSLIVINGIEPPILIFE